MGILRRSLEGRMEYHEVEKGVKSSCRIPVFPNMRVDILVRCPNPVDLNAVTEEGQIMLLDSGKDVRWSGRTTAGITAVEIVADIGFWYLCQKSGLFEFNDGVPLKVELVHTEQDVLKMMIEERLRQYKVAVDLQRDLTDDEVESLVLDIAAGELEFDMPPDEFGIGYEESLKKFVERAEQSEQPPAPPAAAAGSVVEPAPVPPAAGSSSSST